MSAQWHPLKTSDFQNCKIRNLCLKTTSEQSVCLHGGSGLPTRVFHLASGISSLLCPSFWSYTASHSSYSVHWNSQKFTQIQTGLAAEGGVGGRDTSLNGRKVKELGGHVLKPPIPGLAIYNRKLLHFPYLECFLFSWLDPEHSVQLCSLLKFCKFPWLKLVAPTFVLPWLTITFGETVLITYMFLSLTSPWAPGGTESYFSETPSFLAHTWNIVDNNVCWVN